MQESQKHNYQQVNDRLKEIVDLVSDENIALDQALDLLEEAVALGTRASALLEEDIIARSDDSEGELSPDGVNASQE